MRIALLTAFAMMLALPAMAVDWDHDANIARGVEDLLAVSAEGDAGRVQALITQCYTQLEATPSDEALQRLEYCAGMDFAGYLRARDAGPVEDDSFFAPPRLLERMQPLTHWIDSPNVQGEVLRAWSRSAADALARRKAD